MQDPTPPSVPSSAPEPPLPDPMDPCVRYPNMKPVSSPPSLFTLNSFGLGMYGKRDFDEATGCYIKTRCICALFIPLFPIDAYRVADAGEDGWYFLGKERLGPFARFWRKWFAILVVVLIATAFWRGYQSSPAYISKQKYEQAQKLLDDGRNYEALEVYHRMLIEDIGDITTIHTAVRGILVAEIESGDAGRCAKAIAYIEDHPVLQRNRRAIIDDLAGMALTAASKCKDPKDAERILTSFKPIDQDLARVHGALRPVLEELYKAEPGNLERRIKLALLREEFGEAEGALELLEPAASQLGDGEGARLYGNVLVAAGREAEAIAHLERYVTPRIKALRAAGKAFEQAYELARQREFDLLNNTGGPPGFIERYEAASEDEQILMVEDYINGQLERNAGFMRARERYTQSTAVVPTIMNLGIARLRAAQAESDQTLRQSLLKDAEQTFLLMRDSAGDNDETRYFLGQVYYWSGQEDKGRKLFDELLESAGRDYDTLYSLGQLYRSLGERGEARRLLKEAYDKAADVEEQTNAVQTLALLADSADEKIEWLLKGNQDNPWLAISLSQAQAEKALGHGDTKLAIQHYKKALAGYDKLERSATVLNNSATLHQALFRIEGRKEHFDRAAENFSAALELEPGSSILTFNAASSLFSVAVLGEVGEQVDFRLLKEDQGIDTLSYLYSDEAGKAKVIANLKANPSYQKAMARFWEALLLAPKDKSLYQWGGRVFLFTKDTQSMQRLIDKAASQQFDHGPDLELMQKYINKERDEELKKSLQGGIELANALQKSLADSPAALALAQSTVAEAYMSSYTIGEDVQSAKWFAALDKATREARCSHLVGARNEAVAMIALEQLAATDAECREIIEANRRTLSHHDILRVLAHSKGGLGERVNKHPAVQRVRECAKESDVNYPSTCGLYEWLLADDGSVEALRQKVLANQSELLYWQLQRHISHDSPGRVMSEYWLCLLENNDAGAKEQKAKLVKAGVKLPATF